MRNSSNNSRKCPEGQLPCDQDSWFRQLERYSLIVRLWNIIHYLVYPMTCVVCGSETGLVFELDISWSFEESWNSESGFLSELGGGKSRWFETLISRLHLQVRHRSCFCFQRQHCTNSMPTTTSTATTDGGRVAAWTNRFFPSAACHHRHHYEYY